MMAVEGGSLTEVTGTWLALNSALDLQAAQTHSPMISIVAWQIVGMNCFALWLPALVRCHSSLFGTCDVKNNKTQKMFFFFLFFGFNKAWCRQSVYILVTVYLWNMTGCLLTTCVTVRFHLQDISTADILNYNYGVAKKKQKTTQNQLLIRHPLLIFISYSCSAAFHFTWTSTL